MACIGPRCKGGTEKIRMAVMQGWHKHKSMCMTGPIVAQTTAAKQKLWAHRWILTWQREPSDPVWPGYWCSWRLAPREDQEACGWEEIRSLGALRRISTKAWEMDWMTLWGWKCTMPAWCLESIAVMKRTDVRWYPGGKTLSPMQQLVLDIHVIWDAWIGITTFNATLATSTHMKFEKCRAMPIPCLLIAEDKSDMHFWW